MRFANVVMFLSTLAVLSACAAIEGTQGADPYEADNRNAHAINKDLDKALLRPASKAYGAAVPQPVAKGVRNVGENLATPSYVINNALQGDVEGVGTGTLRFAVNTTFGIAGIFDVASALGLPKEKADFGQTLHVWGASQGGYVEVPALGPSTERDLVGRVVDAVINPVTAMIPSEAVDATQGVKAANIMDARASLGTTLDDVLYNSADSYAQTKTLYLQNRQRELNAAVTSSLLHGDAAQDEGYDDIYEDIYE